MEWMTQALRAAASNAQAEGFTPTMAAASQTVRVRRANQVQILADDYSVSFTQEYVDKAGLGQSSEFDEQSNLRELEVMKDADRALLVSTTVTRDGDAGTASQMDGALAWAPSAGGFRMDGQGAALSKDTFEELSHTIWQNSGQTADLIVCAGKVRGQISTWTTQFKQHDTKDTTLVDTVETYRGDWGTQVVLPDPHMTTTSLLLCRKEYLKKAYLRPIAHYELGQTIDGRQGYVVMEVTLEAQNPNTVGRITGLLAA